MSFSKQRDYEREVLPHVKEILLKCDVHRIPVFMTFAVGDSEKGTKYETEMISPTVLGVTLKDDRLARHALVMAGFDTVPPQRRLVFEEEQEVIAVEPRQEEPQPDVFLAQENTAENLELSELNGQEET